MNAKRTGWAYLWMTIAFILASVAVSALFPGLGIGLTAFLSELCLLIPALFFLLQGRTQLTRQLHFRMIKPSTVLLIIVYHICCYPLIIAMNAFTMAISDNAAMELTSQFEGESFIAILLFAGIIGPIVEELVFRGALLSGLRTTGRILTAIILSGFLFGMIHMNLNQFSYAVCMGIFWGLLVEATGSIISSMICHVATNSLSVFMSFLLEDYMGDMDEILAATGSQSAAAYVYTGITFLFISIFTTIGAMLLLRVIALNEGRTGCFENIFRKKSRAECYGRLFSVPLTAGMVISAAVIIFMMISDMMP